MMLIFGRVQLLLVVLAARHTAEGGCARSDEVRAVERNGGHDAGAVRGRGSALALVCLGGGGRFRDFGVARREGTAY